ncbi:MAG: DMT family transporter [Fimbriimonadaceae bacterium]|nr:DMT family transporter [Fimbriimonadaceae bacterium]
MRSQTAILTLLTLIAFAANSVLCRLALASSSIDPASFTSLRLASGALTLWLIVIVPKGVRPMKIGGDWLSGAMLFLYAVAFSFAYVSLTAGTGALILFISVQITMIGVGIVQGNKPKLVEWVGLIIALCGIVYLVMPGLKAPSPVGAALMAMAGIAWGAYSLRGRGVKEPGLVTAGNFIRSTPIIAVVWCIAFFQLHLSTNGIILAIISGALTSGIGYILWYSVLPNLTPTRAAVVQLCVPVLAAVAGVVALHEEATMRLAISSVLTLGGVGLAVLSRTRFVESK